MAASVRLAVSLILVIYNSSRTFLISVLVIYNSAMTFLISVFSKGSSSHISVAISFLDSSALADLRVSFVLFNSCTSPSIDWVLSWR